MIKTVKKIFVADDDQDILQIISIMLKTKGYEVYTSRDPEEIFEYTELSLPDLILLDIWMSGIDGREICYKLKSDPLTKDIPLLFISANANIVDITKEYKADGFIAKPFEMSSLLNTIEKSLQSIEQY